MLGCSSGFCNPLGTQDKQILRSPRRPTRRPEPLGGAPKPQDSGAQVAQNDNRRFGGDYSVYANLKTGLAMLAILFLLASVAHGATGGVVSGIVKGPGGAPFEGAFVRARNQARKKITFNVLSDQQGRYRIENLSQGEYEVWATAIGYKAEPRTGVKVVAGVPPSVEFTLQKSMVQWSELDNAQAEALLPEGPGKKEFLGQCTGCHGFQDRIAGGKRRDEAGWRAVMSLMKMVGPERSFKNDQENAAILSYLTSVFGPNSKLPRSPEELPEYQKVKHNPPSGEATKIVYVDYELPAANRFAWSAAPDEHGNVWIPYHQNANAIGKLDPNTGEIQDFKVPNQGVAGVHSAVAAPDGTVWLVENRTRKIGKWDPRTQAITEYQNPGEGSENTVRIDPKGFVWASGGPLIRFDPETKKFFPYSETTHTYGITLDREGSLWFAEYTKDGQIGKVDIKTGKLTKYSPPTPNAQPRRIQIDPDGIVWFGEFEAGKIGRFDPKTESFKEYPLPGDRATPYALGIDANNNIWYSSEFQSIIGRLDPKSGHVTVYPSPYTDSINMREFFLDAQGRFWYGTTGNHKVGYFYLASGNAK